MSAYDDEETILDNIYEALQADDSHSLTDKQWYGIVPRRDRAFLYVKIDGRCYQIVANPHPHPLED